jgi:hypothetical protein
MVVSTRTLPAGSGTWRCDGVRFAPPPERLGVAQVVAGVQVFVRAHVDRGPGPEEPVPPGQIQRQRLIRVAVAVHVKRIVRNRGVAPGIDGGGAGGQPHIVIGRAEGT